MNAHKYKIKWQTTISISRPFYEGEEIVYAFEDKVEEKAKKDIARNGGFDPSEIEILEITKLPIMKG